MILEYSTVRRHHIYDAMSISVRSQEAKNPIIEIEMHDSEKSRVTITYEEFLDILWVANNFIAAQCNFNEKSGEIENG